MEKIEENDTTIYGLTGHYIKYKFEYYIPFYNDSPSCDPPDASILVLRSQ
jgi:hypothetical protein